MREQALQCQAWLHAALTAPTEPPSISVALNAAQANAEHPSATTTTVAITHFAPSLRSSDPRYGLTPTTAGFCNALDSYLDHADFWLHGHLHCPSNYVHHSPTGRTCRVLANPLGYARNNEQAAFLPEYIVTV